MVLFGRPRLRLCRMTSRRYLFCAHASANAHRYICKQRVEITGVFICSEWLKKYGDVKESALCNQPEEVAEVARHCAQRCPEDLAKVPRRQSLPTLFRQFSWRGRIDVEELAAVAKYLNLPLSALLPCR